MDYPKATLHAKRAKSGDWHRAENVPPEHRATAGSLTQPQARNAILTRLLKLNHQRAAEEANARLAGGVSTKGRKGAKQGVFQLPPDDLDLFRSASK